MENDMGKYYGTFNNIYVGFLQKILHWKKGYRKATNDCNANKELLNTDTFPYLYSQ